MLTILADENIANIDDYMAHHDVRVIKLAGRDINQHAINSHRPHALFIRSVTPINPKSIHDFGDVRFIGSATIGTDHVDIAHLAKHGVCFANAQGCSKHSVAQYVISSILSLRPHLAHQSPTLGIIGLGNIGSTLATYAQALGWQVAGFDPFLPKSAINNSDFEGVLTSDIISIHTPLTKIGNHPTHQLFNQNTLKTLKNNALLINTARGEIICQDDLICAIDNQNLQVVLDVFPFEPSIDKALLERLAIATPHIAGYTLEGKLRGTDMIYQAFCQTFDLPITQHLEPLLPANPYHWTQFLATAQAQANLRQFYNIRQDDMSLRNVCHDGVKPADFDALRKNYNLRREWIFA